MEELEQAVNDAIDAFTAAVITVAERAAITAIRSAFATAAQQTARAHAARTRLVSARASASRRALNAISRAEPLDVALARIVACVREHPGLTVHQLVQYLDLPDWALRRHLHRLARENVIRIETRPTARFGGQPLMTYFHGSRAAAGCRDRAHGGCMKAQAEPTPTELAAKRSWAVTPRTLRSTTAEPKEWIHERI